jgi:hypothetical protein
VKRKLRLVRSNEPTDIFDNLERLRARTPGPSKRERATATFARIPHDLALELYRSRVSGDAFVVLIELDRIILKHRGQNPVKFVSPRLRQVGLAHYRRHRALQQLVAARVTKIESRGPGLAPWVTHSWFPLRD